jgi:hypothetical protein
MESIAATLLFEFVSLRRDLVVEDLEPHSVRVLGFV